VKLLVIAADTVSPEDLRAALPADCELTGTEVMIVAPALQESRLRFWMSDADQAIERAQQVGRSTLEALERDGVPATADTGESDVTTAIEDALRSFPADRIILFTRPPGDGRVGEEVDGAALERRWEIPVTRHPL
jgi:hypothetical protein